jgi:hypothetical protein
MRYLVKCLVLCLCVGVLSGCSVLHHFGFVVHGLKDEERCLRDVLRLAADVNGGWSAIRHQHPDELISTRWRLERAEGELQLTYTFEWTSQRVAPELKGPRLLSKLNNQYLLDRAEIERCVDMDRYRIICTLLRSPLDDAACRAFFNLPALH